MKRCLTGLLVGLTCLAMTPAAHAADRYVSPTGSDTGACTQASPCLTFNYAYQAASAGDIVHVASGTYGDQNLLEDPSKTSATDVTFVGDPGANVGSLNFGATYDQIGAAHVTVEDLELRSWATFHRTVDTTLRDVIIHGGVFSAGARQLAFHGGSWGDPNVTTDGTHPEFTTYNRPGNVVTPDGLIVSGVHIHHIQRTATEQHTNCLHIQDGEDIQIVGNRFDHCDAFSSLVSPSNGIDNITFENNLFEPSTDVNGAGSGLHAVILDPESAPITNVTVRNNTFAQQLAVKSGTVSGRIVGNLGANGTCSSLTYSHNVWTSGDECSATDQLVPNAGWVGGGDYHLTASSPAVDAGDPLDHPAVDLDGIARPRGTAPDAGAYESPYTGSSDTTPPNTTITASPPASTTSTAASFSFTGTDNVSAPAALSFECSLDGGAYASCTSPRSYTSVATGQHTFSARATDEASNTDPTPATHSWTILPPASSTLIGETTIQPDADFVTGGQAEAFQATASATGTMTSMKLTSTRGAPPARSPWASSRTRCPTTPGRCSPRGRRARQPRVPGTRSPCPAPT